MTIHLTYGTKGHLYFDGDLVEIASRVQSAMQERRLLHIQSTADLGGRGNADDLRQINWYLNPGVVQTIAQWSGSGPAASQYSRLL